MTSHFCVIKTPQLQNAIAKTDGAAEMTIGECRHAYWFKTDMLVLYFGDQTQQESQADYEAENSLLANQVTEQNALASEEQGVASPIFIHFRVNKAHPYDQAEIASVVHAAELASQHGIKVIHIVGYTDNTGEHAYNMNLSIRRAESIRKILLKEGIKATITVKGRAEANPVASNATEEGRAKNRRAEVHGGHKQ